MLSVLTYQLKLLWRKWFYSLLTIISPVLIGLIFGAEPLGGYMAGVCVSGVV